MRGEIIFLGTGSSAGIPYIFHLMLPHDDECADMLSARGLPVSRKAQVGDPRYNKDYRCNVSILVKFWHAGRDEQAAPMNVLIDAGKTFRESACRWFPLHDIRSIDAVVVTHGHADAIFGIDDLRSTQSRSSTQPLNVYQSFTCMQTTRKVFEYLYPKEGLTEYCCPCGQSQDSALKGRTPLPSNAPIVGTSTPKINRFVANLNWIVVDEFEEFEPIAGLKMVALPVMHGEDLVCFGYLFGRNHKVCYLSDVSRVIPATMELLRSTSIELLIIDSLHPTMRNPVHFSMEEALELCRVLRPNRTLLVGMAATFDHNETNEKLKMLLHSEGLDIQLAYDGLNVEIDI
jgi:phosphoribosyl 1,2-cyclic phosphodiesterase